MYRNDKIIQEKDMYLLSLFDKFKYNNRTWFLTAFFLKSNDYYYCMCTMIMVFTIIKKIVAQYLKKQLKVLHQDHILLILKLKKLFTRIWCVTLKKHCYSCIENFLLFFLNRNPKMEVWCISIVMSLSFLNSRNIS